MKIDTIHDVRDKRRFLQDRINAMIEEFEVAGECDLRIDVIQRETNFGKKTRVKITVEL